MTDKSESKPAVETVETSGLVRLRRLEDGLVTVGITGMSPLIPHRWSQKARQQMKTRQTGTGLRDRRQPKIAEEEAYNACYWLTDGQPGMPATAFKAAMIEAVRFFDGLTMTQAKRMLFVEGEGPERLVAIRGDKHLREDFPRNASGVVDLRYRYAFDPWEASITVRYLKTQISEESILALLDAGGRNGVGDWRPGSPKSNTGTFGTFRVKGL